MMIGHTLIGTGDTKVLVLHGWFGDYTAFEPTFNSFDLNALSFAFVDYRGYGKSKDMSGEYSMKEIAADAIALVDELGWQDFHIVGHSMGGMAAQRVLVDIDNPARIKSIIAVTPVPACGVPFDEGTHDLFHGAINNDENRYNILDFTTGNRNSAAWLNYMVEHSHETTIEAAYAGYLTAWSETDFSDEVKGNEVPMLVCIGAHDPAFTEEAMTGSYMAWYPNARLEIIANAGHYPMFEAPVNLATLIGNFIAEH